MALVNPVSRANYEPNSWTGDASGPREDPAAGFTSFPAEEAGEMEAEHGVRVTTVYPGRTATPMQEKVHAQEGKDYDPGAWIRPETVADAIVGVLDLPVDATLTDVTIRPR